MTLDEKISRSESILQYSYEKNDGRIFISFSGGKDSVVLRHIAVRLFPDIKIVFSDTTNELSEIYKYIKTFPEVIHVHPTISFSGVVQKYGFPLVSKETSQKVNELKHTKGEPTRNTRLNGDEKGNGKLSNKWQFLAEQSFDLTHKCCSFLKKLPLEKWAKEHDMVPVIGLMSGESRLRLQLSLYGKDDGKKIYPFLRTGWTDEDIWEYATRFNIRFADCYYDRVVKGVFLPAKPRSGCEYCGFGVHMEDNNRFERSAVLSPKRFEKMMSLENNGVTFREALKIVTATKLPEPILGLYGFNISGEEQKESTRVVSISPVNTETRCPSCRSKNIVARKKTNKIEDIMKTTLLLSFSSYACKACEHSFHDLLPGIDIHKKKTLRLLAS